MAALSSPVCFVNMEKKTNTKLLQPASFGCWGPKCPSIRFLGLLKGEHSTAAHFAHRQPTGLCGGHKHLPETTYSRKQPKPCIVGLQAKPCQSITRITRVSQVSHGTRSGTSCYTIPICCYLDFEGCPSSDPAPPFQICCGLHGELSALCAYNHRRLERPPFSRTFCCMVQVSTPFVPRSLLPHVYSPPCPNGTLLICTIVVVVVVAHLVAIPSFVSKHHLPPRPSHLKWCSDVGCWAEVHARRADKPALIYIR
mmetsp:Transcript_15773/g.27945  ORF Transcript_15773/g.27945 Transcript_15773/m.27945 type:complete len:254 (-) Transcript_15773:317-1078(-)